MASLRQEEPAQGVPMRRLIRGGVHPPGQASRIKAPGPGAVRVLSNVVEHELPRRLPRRENSDTGNSCG